MIVAGIDVGSLTAEAVILKNDELAAWSIIRTGSESAKTALKALEVALAKTDIEQADIQYTVATGYGRVVVPFANKNITEISCHAKGANWFFPKVRTVLDMGGQDCKAIRCNEVGKVKKFLMNDKCAAGTGRAMEVMAELLEVPLEDMGRLSLEIDGPPPPISNTCVVFAKSEVLSLIRQGTPRNLVLAGLCEATANRIKTLLNAVGMEEDFMVSGGISKNIGIIRRIEGKMGVKANMCFEPQIVGALGAALFARDHLSGKKG